MKSKEALNDIEQWGEYITRLDYVEPEVRNEVKKLLYDAYHKTTPEFKIIKKDLEVLEILKNKNVNICLLKDSYSLEDYNNTCIYLGGYSNQISKSIPITKEEYNLLKEMIK